jgi:hypothetical protein
MSLKVDTSDCPGRDAMGLIILDKLCLASMFSEEVQAQDFGEVATLILDLPRDDFQGADHFESAKFHVHP